MYEALTGRVPFSPTSSDFRIREAIVEGRIPSPVTLRPDLRGITMRSKLRVADFAPRGYHVKGIGIGIVRWLVGIILGLVAASFLFGLVARVTSSPTATAPALSRKTLPIPIW